MKAELISSMGDDLMVVNAARVSMDKESTSFTYRKDVPKGSDEGLLSYLATENHWTPYSHCRETFLIGRGMYKAGSTSLATAGSVVDDKIRVGTKVRHSIWGWAKLIESGALKGDAIDHVSKALSFKYPESWKVLGVSVPDAVNRDAQVFHLSQESEENPDFIDVTMRETVPIFVARQRFKHSVGFSYNEVSRRYVDTPPEFYTPDVWRSRPEGSIKQGSGESTVSNESLWIDTDGHEGHLGVWESDALHYEDLIRLCATWYENAIKQGVAPEQARLVLPQSMLTSYYVTGSLSAWARAYKLRIDTHSQVEIQGLAAQWDTIIAPLFPESWKVLTQ